MPAVIRDDYGGEKVVVTKRAKRVKASKGKSGARVPKDAAEPVSESVVNNEEDGYCEQDDYYYEAQDDYYYEADVPPPSDCREETPPPQEALENDDAPLPRMPRNIPRARNKEDDLGHGSRAEARSGRQSRIDVTEDAASPAISRSKKEPLPAQKRADSGSNLREQQSPAAKAKTDSRIRAAAAALISGRPRKGGADSSSSDDRSEDEEVRKTAVVRQRSRDREKVPLIRRAGQGEDIPLPRISRSTPSASSFSGRVESSSGKQTSKQNTSLLPASRSEKESERVRKDSPGDKLAKSKPESERGVRNTTDSGRTGAKRGAISTSAAVGKTATKVAESTSSKLASEPFFAENFDEFEGYEDWWDEDEYGQEQEYLQEWLLSEISDPSTAFVDVRDQKENKHPEKQPLKRMRATDRKQPSKECGAKGELNSRGEKFDKDDEKDLTRRRRESDADASKRSRDIEPVSSKDIKEGKSKDSRLIQKEAESVKVGRNNDENIMPEDLSRPKSSEFDKEKSAERKLETDQGKENVRDRDRDKDRDKARKDKDTEKENEKEKERDREREMERENEKEKEKERERERESEKEREKEKDKDKEKEKEKDKAREKEKEDAKRKLTDSGWGGNWGHSMRVPEPKSEKGKGREQKVPSKEKEAEDYHMELEERHEEPREVPLPPGSPEKPARDSGGVDSDVSSDDAQAFLGKKPKRDKTIKIQNWVSTPGGKKETSKGVAAKIKSRQQRSPPPKYGPESERKQKELELSVGQQSILDQFARQQDEALKQTEREAERLEEMAQLAKRAEEQAAEESRKIEAQKRKEEEAKSVAEEAAERTRREELLKDPAARALEEEKAREVALSIALKTNTSTMALAEAKAVLDEEVRSKQTPEDLARAIEKQESEVLQQCSAKIQELVQRQKEVQDAAAAMLQQKNTELEQQLAVQQALNNSNQIKLMGQQKQVITGQYMVRLKQLQARQDHLARHLQQLQQQEQVLKAEQMKVEREKQGLEVVRQQRLSQSTVGNGGAAVLQLASQVDGLTQRLQSPLAFDAGTAPLGGDLASVGTDAAPFPPPPLPALPPPPPPPPSGSAAPLPASMLGDIMTAALLTPPPVMPPTAPAASPAPTANTTAPMAAPMPLLSPLAPLPPLEKAELLPDGRPVFSKGGGSPPKQQAVGPNEKSGASDSLPQPAGGVPSPPLLSPPAKNGGSAVEHSEASLESPQTVAKFKAPLASLTAPLTGVNAKSGKWIPLKEEAPLTVSTAPLTGVNAKSGKWMPLKEEAPLTVSTAPLTGVNAKSGKWMPLKAPSEPERVVDVNAVGPQEDSALMLRAAAKSKAAASGPPASLAEAHEASKKQRLPESGIAADAATSEQLDAGQSWDTWENEEGQKKNDADGRQSQAAPEEKKKVDALDEFFRERPLYGGEGRDREIGTDKESSSHPKSEWNSNGDGRQEELQRDETQLDDNGAQQRFEESKEGTSEDPKTAHLPLTPKTRSTAAPELGQKAKGSAHEPISDTPPEIFKTATPGSKAKALANPKQTLSIATPKPSPLNASITTPKSPPEKAAAIPSSSEPSGEGADDVRQGSSEDHHVPPEMPLAPSLLPLPMPKRIPEFDTAVPTQISEQGAPIVSPDVSSVDSKEQASSQPPATRLEYIRALGGKGSKGPGTVESETPAPLAESLSTGIKPITEFSKKARHPVGTDVPKPITDFSNKPMTPVGADVSNGIVASASQSNEAEPVRANEQLVPVSAPGITQPGDTVPETALTALTAFTAPAASESAALSSLPTGRLSAPLPTHMPDANFSPAVQPKQLGIAPKSAARAALNMLAIDHRASTSNLFQAGQVQQAGPQFLNSASMALPPRPPNPPLANPVMQIAQNAQAIAAKQLGTVVPPPPRPPPKPPLPPPPPVMAPPPGAPPGGSSASRSSKWDVGPDAPSSANAPKGFHSFAEMLNPDKNAKDEKVAATSVASEQKENSKGEKGKRSRSSSSSRSRRSKSRRRRRSGSRRRRSRSRSSRSRGKRSRSRGKEADWKDDGGPINPDETRLHPVDKMSYNYVSFSEKFKEHFTAEELEVFWRQQMKPRSVVQGRRSRSRRRRSRSRSRSQSKSRSRSRARRSRSGSGKGESRKLDSALMESDEVRLNPEDKRYYTFRQLAAKFAKAFKPAELEAFWKKHMKPRPDVSASDVENRRSRTPLARTPLPRMNRKPPNSREAGENDQPLPRRRSRTPLRRPKADDAAAINQEEVRYNPEDNKYYTFQQLTDKYSYRFKSAELEKFWKDHMRAKGGSQDRQPLQRMLRRDAPIARRLGRLDDKILRRRPRTPPRERDDGGTDEERWNPEDERYYSLAKLKQKFSHRYSPEELEEFWRTSMKPRGEAETASPSRAERDAARDWKDAGEIIDNDEKRHDPADREVRNFEEVRAHYKDMSPEDQESYWREKMKPLWVVKALEESERENRRDGTRTRLAFRLGRFGRTRNALIRRRVNSPVDDELQDKTIRRKGKGRGKGKTKSKKKVGQAPEKFEESCWEQPREKKGLSLLGETASKTHRWHYVVEDNSRRSYAAQLSGCLTEAQGNDFFEEIRNNTNWLQPEGSKGPIPRKTMWTVRSGCTCPYRYGGIEVGPVDYPDWMLRLLGIIMPACGLNEVSRWPDSCNVNLYEDGGMSVGWHADDEAIFQGNFQDIVIISLSLGVARTFEVRLNWPEEGEKEIVSMKLGHGDLMTMEGMMQKHFQHRVPKEENIQGARINLTWRWILRHHSRCPCSRGRQYETVDAPTVPDAVEFAEETGAAESLEPKLGNPEPAADAQESHPREETEATHNQRQDDQGVLV